VDSKELDLPKIAVKKPVFNATLINLMLMTLASSAPQIYLSIFDTCWTLGELQG
jgi:hypothetical protein